MFEEGEDTREAGERLAASYVNFYIGNKVVLVPQFGDEHDVLATDLLQKLFPEREIVPVFARRSSLAVAISTASHSRYRCADDG